MYSESFRMIPSEGDSEFQTLSESSKARDKISGYLLKQSKTGDWQRRYFETNGTYLTYYKTDKMTKLLAALSLPQVGEIKFIEHINDEKGDGYVFLIDLRDRQYILRAETLSETEKWIDVLTYLRDGQTKSNVTYSSQSNDEGIELNSKSGFTQLLSDSTEKSHSPEPPTRTEIVMANCKCNCSIC